METLKGNWFYYPLKDVSCRDYSCVAMRNIVYLVHHLLLGESVFHLGPHQENCLKAYGPLSSSKSDKTLPNIGLLFPFSNKGSVGNLYS